MAEGFFSPDQIQVPRLTVDQLCASMVRILPRTLLVLDIVPSADEARARARNEALPDGSECWYRFFTPDDIAQAADPEFAMGMVRHEFARVVRSEATFPTTVPLDGGGSGFAVTSTGLLVTNYHLVTAEIANYRREAGVVAKEVPCRSLRAQVAMRNGEGAWEWRDAKALWLVSNPPQARAVWQHESGSSHLKEDTALLRVEPCPSMHLDLSAAPVGAGDRVWMAGFPLRSARSVDSLRALGYQDADGSLRVSTGEVLAGESTPYFTTDLDGSMGNSGSPVFNARGEVVGMFSRALGNGPRNAFEYGHLKRVAVSTALIVEGLDLEAHSA